MFQGYVYVCVCSVVSNSLQLLNCRLPGPSVHGIFQTRILEWVAISSSRISSQPRDQTSVSYVSLALAGRLFTTSATWKAKSKIRLFSSFIYLTNI